MKLFRLALLIFIIGSCKGQKQAPLQTNRDENSLLWEISGNGLDSSSYLFGTFHLLCKNDIHFSDQLKKAVQYSHTVYMELDMDDPSVMLGGLLLMTMKDGRSLKDLYRPEEYTRVRTFFEDSLQMPLLMIQNIKPAFLESLLYPKMMACKSVSGVDEEIARLATQDKKEIKGLETMEFQASVFDSIPYKDQARELLKTIDSLPEYKLDFDTMIRVYQSQNIKQIEDLFNKNNFSMEEDNKDLLLNNRNLNWVKQLKEIVKKERVFVAVGAGHLVGEQGLIALLKKEGYHLRPLTNQ